MTKLVNQELNAVRNVVIKANEENQDKAERLRVEAALRHSKYAILKPEKQLTENQKIKLLEVKAVSPLLASMHQQKETFRAIFQTAENWSDGTLRLLDWLAENQVSFQLIVGTICRWFGEVVGYFENRTTSQGERILSIRPNLLSFIDNLSNNQALIEKLMLSSLLSISQFS